MGFEAIGPLAQQVEIVDSSYPALQRLLQNAFLVKTLMVKDSIVRDFVSEFSYLPSLCIVSLEGDSLDSHGRFRGHEQAYLRRTDRTQ